MPDNSPILALPFLMPSQAQKHVTHNEALRRLDIVVQLSVVAFDATTPPADPAEGEVHALGAAPVVAWAGHAGDLAAWLDGTWHFVTPLEGWRAWGKAEQQVRVWTGSDWVLPQAELAPLTELGIATAADATNRLAVSADATLLTHDGGGHQLKINKANDGETASVLFQSNWAGHAEMGLAGDTDFAIKVSINGVAWTEALRFDATTGMAEGSAVQTSRTDIRPGALMTVGAFGLGDTAGLDIVDFDDAVRNGYYTVTDLSSAVNAPPGFTAGPASIHTVASNNSNNVTQIAFKLNGDGEAAIRYQRAGIWKDWRMIYTQQSLLAPVGQSGGTPTGGVIERGRTPNGDYVRFADGTQICTNANAPITAAPATFSGPITKIDGDKLWIGTWF
jgi:hypothetical protein